MSNVLFPTASAQKVMPIWNTSHPLADEGNFYVACNATMGTALAVTTAVVDDAATASATHAQYSPIMVVQNGWAASDPNAKVIYPMYLRLVLSGVPTAASNWQLSIRADNNPNFVTTAGTQLTPYNTNIGSGTTSKALIYFGTNVVSLTNSQGRLLGHAQLNSTTPVKWDSYKITFGHSAGTGSDQISGGSGAKNVIFGMPAIAIAPGWNIRIGTWGAGNTGEPTYEVEFGYVERIAGL